MFFDTFLVNFGDGVLVAIALVEREAIALMNLVIRDRCLQWSGACVIFRLLEIFPQGTRPLTLLAPFG